MAGPRVWVGVCVGGLAALLLAAGCAQRQAYWTRGEATEQQFRRVSRVCNEKAQIQVFEESRRSGCQGSGCGPSRGDSRLPFPEADEKRRLERRRQFLYGQCLESRGWVKNYEGRGYEGR
jgi:hypothetical protein